MPIRHRQGEAFHCDVIVWSSWCQSGIVRVRHFCLWCYCLVVMMPIRHRQGEAFLFVVLLFGRHDANQASSGWGISVCGVIVWSSWCQSGIVRVRHFCLWCYCLVVMMPIRHRQGEAFLFVVLLFGRHDANQASSGWGISVCGVIVWSSWCQSGIVRVRHFCLWCYCLVVMMPIRHRQGEAFLFVVLLFGRHDANQASSGWGISVCGVIVWSSSCQSGIVRVRHFCLWMLEFKCHLW